MSGSNILVVEDEMVIAMEIRATLKKLGYNVVGSAINGYDAIQTAGEKMPDLVLMDIRLKGDMDGIEAAQKIMANYDLPVIFLTGNSDKVTLERAVSIKPAGFLVKPFKERELLANIEMAIHKSKVHKQIEPKQVNASERSLEIINDHLETVKTPFLTVDGKGIIKNINMPAVNALKARSVSEAVGRNFIDFFDYSPDDLLSDGDDMKFVFADKLSLKADETKSSFDIDAGFILDKNNSLVNLLLSVSNNSRSVDDRRNSKRRMDKEFLNLMDSLSDTVYIVDKKMMICEHNEQFNVLAERLGITNYKRGLPLYEIKELTSFASSNEYIEVFKTKTPLHKTKRLRTTSNKYTFFSVNLMPEIEDGVVHYVTTVITDITSIVMAQEHSKKIAENLNGVRASLAQINMIISDLNTPLQEIIGLTEKRPQSILQSINSHATEMAEILQKFNIHKIDYDNSLDKLVELDKEARNWNT